MKKKENLKEEEKTSREEFDELIDWAGKLQDDFQKLKELSDRYDEIEDKKLKKEIAEEFLDFLKDSETLEDRLEVISEKLKKIVKDMEKRLS